MSPGLSFEPIMQARCDCCDSTIPQSNVVGNNLPPAPGEPYRRRYLAHCEHCNRIYQRDYAIDGEGFLHPLGRATLVTDPQRRMSFLNRIAFTKGDRQVG